MGNRGDNAIRHFKFKASDEALMDLRRRVAATKWPSRELVTDASQGVQLATMRELASYWQKDLRLAQVRNETERLAPVLDHDRWRGHSFHPRSFEASECVADHRHARMARLDHRADEDHRTADQPNSTRRERIGRFRHCHPVVAGPWIFGKAAHLGWDPVRIARAWIVLMKRLGYTRYRCAGRRLG